MEHSQDDPLELLEDGDELIETIEISDTEQTPEDLAEDLQEAGLVETSNEGDDDDEWRAEDEEENDMEESMMEPERDDSSLTFSKHTGSVFCAALDPISNSVCVTGGEDDRAFVWRLCDAEELFQCTGHRDSVTCVCFSCDSELIASGDMSGLIQVWSLKSQKWVWSAESGELEWLLWHPSGPVLMAGSASGLIWIWKVPSGACRTLQSPGSRSTSGVLLPQGKQLMVGYEDGSLRLWDLKHSSTLHIFKGSDGHSRAVTALSCNVDGSLVLSGAEDGLAILISTTSGKVLCRFSSDEGEAKSSLNEDEPNSVESVGFCDVLPWVAVAYLDGTLDIYDLNSQTLRHRWKNQAGLVCLRWVRAATLLGVCDLAGVVTLLDARTGLATAVCHGHQAEILDLQINRDASVVVTAGGDQKAKVFSLPSHSSMQTHT